MNNIKKFSALLVFAEVAKHKSFTEAAKQLGVSKSATSQQVRRLEDQIGMQLLSRHTRGMSLTTAGEKLVDRCELLREQVDLTIEELDSAREVPSGTFSLTIPHSCEKNVVIPALSQLCIEFPFIEPDLHVNDSVQDLINDNLDVSIYGGDLKDSGYRALPLGSAKETFYCAPGYIQKMGHLRNIAEVNKHKFIATSWQNKRIEVLHSKSNKNVHLEIEFSAKTNTLASAIEMAVNNMGIILAPAFSVQSEIARGALVRVLPEVEGRQWPFYFVHRFQGEKPLHITRFYHLVKHYFIKACATE